MQKKEWDVEVEVQEWWEGEVSVPFWDPPNIARTTPGPLPFPCTQAKTCEAPLPALKRPQ